MPPFDGQHLARAERLYQAGKLREALTLCRRIVGQKKKDDQALGLLARITFDLGQFDEALKLSKAAVALKPKDPGHQLMTGHILAALGKYTDAVRRYERVLKVLPKQPSAVEGMADVYERRGDPKKAKTVLEPFFAAGTETPTMAMIYATAEQVLGNYDRAVDTIGRGLVKVDEGGWLQARHYYLLGRCEEKRGRHDEAFEAYRRANEIASPGFDPGAYVRYFDDVIAAYSAETLAKLARPETASSLPVFIVGMPRSGSTLVEKIIDAHPEAHGTGELPLMHEIVRSVPIVTGSGRTYPACVADLQRKHIEELSRTYLDQITRMAPGAKRAVDKNLAAYAYLGLLDVLFPEGRIIHTVRDPVDTCVSCFAEPLMPAAHAYACDLEHLAIVYRTHDRLMAHWRDVVKIPILEVRYEEMVADQPRVSREIIEFLGLEWDEQCLNYHESSRRARGSSIAPTLSYDQVRRPIYRTSVRRGEHFDAHLGPLRRALGTEPARG